MNLKRTLGPTALWLVAWMGLIVHVLAGPRPEPFEQPVPANNAPVLGNLDGDTVTFQEGGLAILLDNGSNATLTDADSADFAGGNVTVAISTNRVDSEDVLTIRHVGTGPGEIGVSGVDVSFGGTIIGTLNGGTGANALVITLNGSSTPASVQALLRVLTYTNSNDANPSAVNRQVTVTVDDGDGGVGTAVVSLQVTAVNDTPTLVGPASYIAFTGMHLEITGLTFADVDAGTNAVTVTLFVGSGTFIATNSGGVTLLNEGVLLELSGTVGALNAYIAASNVVYVTAPDAFNDLVLSVGMSDGGATGVDPGLTGDASSEIVSKDFPIRVLPAILSVEVPADAIYVAGQNLDFRINLSEPVSVLTNGGVPRLTLDLGGTSVFAVYQPAAASKVLSFRYTVQLADQDADGVVLGPNIDFNGAVIEDSSTNAVGALLVNVPSTAGIRVNGPAPAAIPDFFTMVEDTVLNGNVLTNDFDGNGDALTASLVTPPTNGVVTLSTNGSFVYTPATNAFGIDTFTYKANDGTLDSSPGKVTITITQVNDPVQVGTPLVDQTTTYGNTNFSYTFPTSAFVTVDGDLTYTATGLPFGVILTGTNRTFSGAPRSVGSNFVRVIASSGSFRATNSFNLFVGKTTLVAVADDKSRIYGVTNPLLTITYTGLVLSETAFFTNGPVIYTTATNTSPVGTYPIILTNGLDHRYAFVFTNGTMTIGKATVVAQPVNKSKAFGEPNPPLVISYLGLANGDTEAALDVPPIASTTATLNSPPGTYPITLTGGSDTNYTLVLLDGTLVIRDPGTPRAGGTYYGLFSEVTGVQTNSSGAITLQTPAGTSFSATLRMEGRSYRFTGAFDALGRFTNELIRPGFFPIICELEIGSTNSPFQLSGRIFLSGGGWESRLLAARAAYHSTTNPAPQVGRYSVFWAGTTNIFRDEPFGYSHGSLKVAASGKVQFQGQLADNTTAAEAMVLTEGGRLPFYVSGRGRDSLLGWLSFTNMTNQDVTGSITWNLWPEPKRLLYPIGFRVEKDVYGSRYTPPSGTTNRIINLAAGDFITSIGDVFIIPGLTRDWITNEVLLTTKHHFTTTNGVSLPVRLRPDSGQFSGYLQDPTLGAIYKFSGSLIQKTNVGVGFHTGRFATGKIEYRPEP